MHRSTRGLAAAAALAALASGLAVWNSGAQRTQTEATTATTASAQKPAQTPVRTAVVQDAASLNWHWNRATRRSGYPNGPGWSNRNVQRMARKKRNQARHRAACR